MYSDENNSGGMHFGSMLFGLGAGIAATILFATYNEKRFRQVTQRARGLTDRTGDYFQGVEDNVLEHADDMVDSARNGAKRLGKKTRQAVSKATRTAEQTVDELADSAHGALRKRMSDPA